MILVYDLASLHTRQGHLSKTVDRLEDFYARQKPPIKEDAAKSVFDLMEQLTSDLSLIYGTPFVEWSVDHRINNTFDLTCQCTRIGRYCKYDFVIYRYPSKDPEGDPTSLMPVSGWVEMLPEAN